MDFKAIQSHATSQRELIEGGSKPRVLIGAGHLPVPLPALKTYCERSTRSWTRTAWKLT